MKLSVYKNYKGENGVCVTHYKPTKWDGAMYTKVSPRFESMLLYRNGRITKEEYELRYVEEVLSNLDAMEVYGDLKGKVILTTSNDGIFCFKYKLAEWIEKEIGIKVEEI